MNAIEFLDFILEKHHEGETPEEEAGERDPTWEREDPCPIPGWRGGDLPDGYEWIDDVDK